MILHGSASSQQEVFIGGWDTLLLHKMSIEYITIASEGNAIDFGDLTRCW